MQTKVSHKNIEMRTRVTRESESFTVKLYVGISVIKIICSFQTCIHVGNASFGKKNKIRFFSGVSLQVTKGSMSLTQFFHDSVVWKYNLVWLEFYWKFRYKNKSLILNGSFLLSTHIERFMNCL